MTARQMVLDALTDQTLEQMWDAFREACIDPTLSAQSVRAHRETFIAGAVGILTVERATRRVQRADALKVLDRLDAEGKALASRIVEEHLAAQQAEQETKQ